MPIQRAKFLLYIDKVKNKKELSVFGLWGVKRNKYKITKQYTKNDVNFPLIQKDYSDFGLKKIKEEIPPSSKCKNIICICYLS